MSHDSSSIEIEVYNNGKTLRLLKSVFFTYKGAGILLTSIYILLEPRIHAFFPWGTSPLVYQCRRWLHSHDKQTRLSPVLAGNFQRRKFCKLVTFVEQTFADCSLLPGQRMPRPQILRRKHLQIATNCEICKGFLSRKFPAIRYCKWPKTGWWKALGQD